MNTNKPNDPIVTLQRVIKFTERTAVALSVMLVLGTVSYLSVHAWA
ncbi:hypothetical protein [Alicyclobacillus dauci]|uniref:Uncharacterized protein n=1 Tax=Alicyclobacillus dauci TaxID=1475485 RepID=A0ABY6Z7X9_9BACL|nr:hypothetical protein [Alicyclobacillus dauci]WAH38803.1 hypothetical protein NZD86_10155 [Alicyclobacillus dauci]